MDLPKARRVSLMKSNGLLHYLWHRELVGLNDHLVLSMQQEADKSIAKRSIPGSVVLFLLLSVSAFISAIETDHPVFYYTLLSFSILTIVLHLSIVKSLSRQTDASIIRWKTQFSIVVVFSSINWGTFSSWSLLYYGIDSSTLVYLLFSAGIASGAASAMFIWKRLAQLYLVVLLLPVVFVLEILIDDPLSVWLGFGFLLYFAFLFYQVYRSNDEYWQALINNKKLQVQAQELEKANKAKTEFLSSMSHELRTPLNAILGFGQLLDIDIKDESQKMYIGEVVKAGEHLLALINEVLDLSHVESGKIELAMKNYSLNSIIDESVMLIKPLADAKSIRVINNVGSERHFVAHIDSMRFKQVMLNLLSNAVKYNRDNGSITINIEQKDPKRIRIEIIDTGHGISREQQKLLFEPFTRLNKHENIEGTGIGLAITRRIIELMGGAIGVESEEGEGSKFWIEVVVGSLDEMVDVGTSVQEKSPSIEYTKDSKKLLYVEDNAANLQLITKLLEKHTPHVLISAPDATLGIAIAEAQQPDLVLMDINLPGLDGFQALAKLKNNPKTSAIPVLAISAFATDADIEKAIKSGFCGYITKPVDIRAFLQTIDKILTPRTP